MLFYLAYQSIGVSSSDIAICEPTLTSFRLFMETLELGKIASFLENPSNFPGVWKCFANAEREVGMPRCIEIAPYRLSRHSLHTSWTLSRYPGLTGCSELPWNEKSFRCRCWSYPTILDRYILVLSAGTLANLRKSSLCLLIHFQLASFSPGFGRCLVNHHLDSYNDGNGKKPQVSQCFMLTI